MEIPITISKKRHFLLSNKWMFYRWLRPTHMTVIEMAMLADEFVNEYDAPILTMMFHSMEIMPRRTPFVRTKTGQRMFLRRLEKTIAHLTGKRFKSKTLGTVYNEKLRQIS